MFEKEAKELFRNSCYYETCPACKESFEIAAEYFLQKGAEFGYNKANEWHYVKDGDLPKEEDLVLFKTDVDYYIGKIDYSKKCWWTGFCRDDSISNSFVIAWCEIPKYTQE